MTREALAALFESLKALPDLGEPVDQLAHALQTAGLAIAANADPELVLASALHDIGRAAPVRDRYPSFAHEDAGAEFVADFASHRVAWLVREHVNAKRYLVRTEPYANVLTTRSVVSLQEQGGPMTSFEARVFLAHPWADDAIALRRWDDAAKVPGCATPSIAEIVARFSP